MSRGMVGMIPYCKCRIMGFFQCGDKRESKVFEGMNKAVAFTGLTVRQIARRIDTGGMCKGWTFDLA